MKRIMWTISIISLMGTAIELHFMPEKVPMHYDLAGNIDRWGSKYDNLIFPVIILVMALFWTLFIIYYEKENIKNGGNPYKSRAFAVFICCFVAYLSLKSTNRY